MNLTAIIPPGQTGVVVNGLHQWDYGRHLEIIHSDLPAEMEIHFAATDSKEAIVHVVAGVNGVAEVAIPNVLLEQALPITAWVYRIGDTIGETILTVTMPIQARPRPATAPSLPEEISDKYTEALGAVNTQVEALTAGIVTAAKALEADHAINADTAKKANQATRADEATKATNDANGRKINTTYVSFRDGFTDYTSGALAVGFYQFRVYISPVMFYALLPVAVNEECCAMLGTDHAELGYYQLRVKAGKPSVEFWRYTSYSPSVQTGFQIQYRKIF